MPRQHRHHEKKTAFCIKLRSKSRSQGYDHGVNLKFFTSGVYIANMKSFSHTSNVISQVQS